MATFAIDLLSNKIFLFNGDFGASSGSTPTSGSTYLQVNLYSNLPAANTASGEIYVVRSGSGNFLYNRKPSGFYFSNGTSWHFLGDIPEYFASNNFQIYDNVDVTKGAMFVTSGLTTNIFRKVKIQNSDGTIAYLTDLNTKVNTTVFNTYTGTTAPNSYYNKTQINSYTGVTNTRINNKLDTSIYSAFSATTVTGATNIGSGVGIYSNKTNKNLNLKSLVAGNSIVITTGATSNTISVSTGFTASLVSGTTAKFETVVFPKTAGKGIKVDTTTPTFGWIDITGEINDRGNAQAPVLSAWNETIFEYMFKTANGFQEVFNTFHPGHDYLQGQTTPFIHAHWSIISTPTGAVNWLFDISHARGYNRAAFNPPITVSVTQEAEGTLLEHQIAEIQFAAPGGVITSTINVSITSGAAILTSASALFSASDIGRTIRVAGAGVAGANLDTKITVFTSNTQVTLANNASTTVTAQPAFSYRVIDSDLIEVDSIIKVRTWRDAARTADTLNVSPFLHTVDLHVQSTGIPTKDKNFPFYV